MYILRRRFLGVGVIGLGPISTSTDFGCIFPGDLKLPPIDAISGRLKVC